MISVLNFKEFGKGAIKGFFDLRYHGLTIKGCKLMDGNNGLWFSFPQVKGEQNGETKYFDQMFLTVPEREHVRTLILAGLRAQGLIDMPQAQPQEPQQDLRQPPPQNLAEYRTPANDQTGIPF